MSLIASLDKLMSGGTNCGSHKGSGGASRRSARRASRAPRRSARRAPRRSARRASRRSARRASRKGSTKAPRRSSRKGASKYNIFMKNELARIKKADPSIEHKKAFLQAAHNWKADSGN
jgi:hypothetical protein